MNWTSILSLMQILAVTFAFSANHADRYISFVLNFLHQTNSPNSAVLEKLCWNKEETLQLQRNLTQHNFRYKSIDQNSKILRKRYYVHTYLILINVDCDFELIWNQVADGSLSFYPHIWILFGDFEKVKNRNVHIPMNSFLLTLVRSPNNIKLITAYKIKKTVDSYVEKTIGDWSPIDEKFNFQRVDIFKERTDFMGLSLRVTYIITDNGTMRHFTDYRDKHVDNLTKINYVLYNLIFDLLNATQIRLFSNGWGFEIRKKNGTFAPGMFQDLINDRSDIAGTLAFTPSSRLKYFRYIYPPAKDMDICLVFRAPSLAYYTNVFRLPFSNMVWVAIGLQLICGCLIIFIIFKWESQNPPKGKRNTPNFSDTALMQIAIACQQDFFHEPKSISGKMATFSILIFFTFIYTAFSAKIVLFLQLSTNKINDVGSVYAAGFDFAVEDQPFNQYYFKGPSDRAEEQWRSQIYEKKIRRSHGDKFMSAEKGIQLVRDTFSAFHVERTVAHYLVDKTFSNNQKCSLRFIRSIFKSDMPYLSIPWNSSYIKFFIISFRRLAETGLQDRECKRCYAKKPSCEGKANMFVSVGLIEAYFPLLIFSVGIWLCIMILVFEKLSNRYLKMY